jgi:CSLREA domain-containing protein
MTRRHPVLVRVSLAVLALLAWTAPAAAAVFVDSTADAPDALPGDGQCATAGNLCTLRAAIEEGNAHAGLWEIGIHGMHYTLTTGSELPVTGDVSIICVDTNAATIEGMGSRVFHVEPGGSLALQFIAVRNGTDGSAAGGSGILNEGALSLLYAAVTENTGTVAAGIRNTGTLQMVDAGLSYNGPGPALVNEGTATLVRADVRVNDGIGIVNRGVADLDACHVGQNEGGGILNASLTATLPTLTIHRSELVRNNGLGALFNVGHATLERSTISGNLEFTAPTANASAIYVGSSSATLALENVTISANGNAVLSPAAVAGFSAGALTVRNSIIAGNERSGGGADCTIPVTSLGHNVMSCPLLAPDPTTVNADPLLAPLSDVRVFPTASFRTTMVHRPLAGSPAIDTGDCVEPLDQRDGIRPQGAGCDIGAFETTPLCTGGADMNEARLTLRSPAFTADLSKLAVKAKLPFVDPMAPAIHPLTDGVQVRVEDLGAGGRALFDRTLATLPLLLPDFGCGGWKVNGTTSNYKGIAAGTDACSADRVGRVTLSLKDRRATLGIVGLKLTAKAQMPVGVGPFRVTVVFGGDAVGGDLASDAGACAAHVFTCAVDATGRRFKCS